MSRPEAPMHLWDVFLDEIECEDAKYSAFEAIVIHYQYLVEAIARRIKNKLPSYIIDDDLISHGQLGLIRAIRRYNPEAGPFSRYASMVIYGAVVDGMRKEDFAPRGLRKKQRDLENAVKDMRNSSVSPTPENIARFTGLTMEEVVDLQKNILKADVSPHDPQLLRSLATTEETDLSRRLCSEFVTWLETKDRVVQQIVVLSYWSNLSTQKIGAILELVPTDVQNIKDSFLLEVLPFMERLASD